MKFNGMWWGPHILMIKMEAWLKSRSHILSILRRFLQKENLWTSGIAKGAIQSRTQIWWGIDLWSKIILLNQHVGDIMEERPNRISQKESNMNDWCQQGFRSTMDNIFTRRRCTFLRKLNLSGKLKNKIDQRCKFVKKRSMVEY